MRSLSEQKLRSLISIILILSHIILFASVIVLTELGGFDSDQSKTIFAVTIPFFTIYLAAIGKYIIANKHDTPLPVNDKVNSLFFWFGLIFSLTFPVIIIALIFLKAFNIIRNFSDFTNYLAAAQTLFGAYTGLVVTEIFKTPAEAK